MGTNYKRRMNMTKLKEQVLEVFKLTKSDSVPYYSTIGKNTISELNSAITELLPLGIFPQIVEVSNETLELKFVKADGELTGLVEDIENKMENLREVMEAN